MTEQTYAVESDEHRDARDPRWLMLITGVIGVIAATVLTIDKLKLQDNPDKTFSCDVNAFVSCAGVMASKQSSVLGFPNSLMGIAGFAGVVLLALVLLTRRTLPSLAWVGLQVGVVLGIGFVTWLQYQSIYQIGKLCPYCMVVWTAMIPLFVGVTARNLRAWLPGSGVTRFVSDWAVLIVALWYVAVAALIWFEFGSTLYA